MEERDPAREPGPRPRVDQGHVGGGEPLEIAFDVVGLEAEVVESLAPAVEKSSHPRVGSHGLDELDLARARREERGPDPLIGQLGLPEHGEAESVPPDGIARRQVPHDGGDVVDPLDHSPLRWFTG